MFWQVSHALEGKTISSLHLLVAYVPTSPVNRSESSQIKIWHWEQSDQTKMWHWVAPLLPSYSKSDQTKMWHYWENFLTTQSSNPSKDACWKCLEDRLPSAICRPGLLWSSLPPPIIVWLNWSLNPSYSKINIRNYGVNMQACKHVEHLHGRLANCTPPRLVLRPHRSSSCSPSLWPGPLTLTNK